MADLSLEVTRREQTGKSYARKLRREGKIPAIVYGGHREAAAITVDRKSVSTLIQKSEHGLRSVFLLQIAGSDQTRHAMIKEMEVDPISRAITHIDFIRVVMDEVVRVTIPVHTKGTAVGVKTHGGLLDFQTRELHVECLPGQIPDEIVVDVSNLGIHEFIRVSDIPVPEGVKILDDSERVIVSVSHAKLEAATETAVEEEAAEPEVIRKGKAEEEE